MEGGKPEKKKAEKSAGLGKKAAWASVSRTWMKDWGTIRGLAMDDICAGGVKSTRATDLVRRSKKSAKIAQKICLAGGEVRTKDDPGGGEVQEKEFTGTARKSGKTTNENRAKITQNNRKTLQKKEGTGPTVPAVLTEHKSRGGKESHHAKRPVAKNNRKRNAWNKEGAPKDRNALRGTSQLGNPEESEERGVKSILSQVRKKKKGSGV